MRATRPNPSRNIVPPGPSVPTAPPQGAKLENSVAIREFIQALAEEVETIKKGRGGSSITVYDGIFIRRDGPFFVYTFTTESPLVVMDDAPADVEVGQQKFAGQIISIQGSEISVGIEHDFGQVISEARLITNLWYLLEALRKRYEEVLNGQRTLDWRLAQRLFGFAATTSARDEGDLDLPTSAHRLNDDQKIAIRSVLGSDVHFIWGPPGTGKTQTIGYLIASLVRRNLRVLVASHTNVATDHAIRSAAVLLEDSEDYQSGKLVRLGNISPNVGPQMPRMVVPSNIVEELGRALKARHDSLSLELAKAQSALASLQEIETVLRRKDETERLLNDLTATLQKSLSEHEQAAVRENNLSLQLRKTQEKLAQSRSAGKLKRLFFGLSPQKLQLAGANIETEIEVLRSGSAARLNKHSELKSAIDCARTVSQP